MPDMLVKLYELPAVEPYREKMAAQDVVIRPARPYEISPVRRWILKHFAEGWADEAQACFSRHPVSCLIAVKDENIMGFACYDATAKGYFGPTGVDESARGTGIGTALLIEALHGLKNTGYAYGIIGGAGPVDFYAKVCGATEIPDSKPGFYGQKINRDQCTE